MIKVEPGKSIKLLIDTGSTFSFIRPELARPQYIRKLKDPIAIKTITQSHELEREACLPMFPELEGVGKIRMFLFKFHQFFEGLIGIDVLQQLEAVIDIQNEWFIVANMKQKIHFVAYRPSELSKIEDESKRVICFGTIARRRFYSKQYYNKRGCLEF